MNEKLLSSLGLNEGEMSLFKAVLQAKEVKATALARVAGVKRTTAYGLARALVEKGVLEEDTTKRPRVFKLASPETVLLLLTAEQKRVEEKERIYRSFANELSKLSAEKSYPVPQVRFVERERMEDFLHTRTPEWHTSLLQYDGTWWGFQDHTFVDLYAKWIDWSWKHAPKDVVLKLLSNRSPLEVKLVGKYPQRNIKFWGEATNFTSSVWVVGDYTVMVNTRHEPFYLVEIHDTLMAHNQREVFKNLWPLVS